MSDYSFKLTDHICRWPE